VSIGDRITLALIPPLCLSNTLRKLVMGADVKLYAFYQISWIFRIYASYFQGRDVDSRPFSRVFLFIYSTLSYLCHRPAAYVSEKELLNISKNNIHTFLTPILNGDEWSISGFDSCYTQEKSPWYPLDGRWVGLRPNGEWCGTITRTGYRIAAAQ
jgi:hypothetical protein